MTYTMDDALSDTKIGVQKAQIVNEFMVALTGRIAKGEKPDDVLREAGRKLDKWLVVSAVLEHQLRDLHRRLDKNDMPKDNFQMQEILPTIQIAKTLSVFLGEEGEAE